MPRLLDLFCCEGGASMGYHRAGFDVYGVDLFGYVDKDGKRKGYTRARYPFPSMQGDAVLALARLLSGESLLFTHAAADVEWMLKLADFDAIAASPPCQAYSITKHSHSNEHPDLVGPVRWLLQQSGLPYVMENVPGAPLESPLTLCGTEFNLVAEDHDGRMLHLRRHRLFESNLFLYGNGGCQCAAFKRRGIGVGGAYGGGSVDRQHAKEVRRGGYTPGKDVREALLGIDWMTQNGLSQSIPPAYTEHLGHQLMAHLAQIAAQLLTVGHLTDGHRGMHVRVTMPGGRVHEGTLSFAANPSYRRKVHHWWLIVPSALPHFEHDAISLQWCAGAVVEAA